MIRDIKFYPNTTSLQPEAWYDIDDLERVVHASKIPGGYEILSFELAVSQIEFKNWLTDRIDGKIHLTKDSGTRLFEGRVSEVLPLATNNAVKVTAEGYSANFKDVVFKGVTNSTADYSKSYSAQRPDQIISDMLTNGFASDGLQLSTDLRFIDSSGIPITQAYDKSWDLHRVITDPSFGVTNFGTTDNKAYKFAVWDDRKIHLTVSNTTGSRIWKSFINIVQGGGVVDFPNRVTLDKVRNSITTIFSTGLFSSQVEDAASISAFHRIEYVAAVLTSTDATIADARRDLELAKFKDLNPRTDAIALNRVWDTFLVEHSLCEIRAGDTLIIPDFLSPLILAQNAFNATRVFEIIEVVCDHSQGSVFITPNSDAGDLGSLLAKNGLVARR